MLNRREVGLGMTAAAFTGLSLGGCARLGELRKLMPDFGSGPMATGESYGDLEVDESRTPLLDLPPGFEYKIISQATEDMGSDGLVVPGSFDGMGAFELDHERTILVRNHELAAADVGKGAFVRGVPTGQKRYRPENGAPLPGGTTTLVYNKTSRSVEHQYLSLAGTQRNCSGGATPWGTWLTCEEMGESARDHGWVFEVPAIQDELVEPVALRGLGRFKHEAAAVSPRTRIVYMTEDQIDGLFYRFIPDNPNYLAGGGKLQALAFDGDHRNDARNWGTADFLPGSDNARQVRWVDFTPAEAAAESRSLRRIGASRNAVRFAASEGIYIGQDGHGNEELFFCCTSGGPGANGQIMRYRPSPREGCQGEGASGSLELFLESTNPWAFKHCDNLTMAPNGDLIICEESYVLVGGRREWSYLRGVTPSGGVYNLARSRTPSELAGVCFAADGDTMFVNVYDPGITLAITGPWKRRRAGWSVPKAGRLPGRPDPALGNRCIA